MTDRVDGYAAAIFEVARAEGSLDTVSDELFQFAQVLQGSDQLRQTLTDQTLPPDKRQAETEVAEMRARAQEDIQAQADRAMADLQARVAELAIELAEKVVERSLDRETNLALIEEYINQVGASSS